MFFIVIFQFSSARAASQGMNRFGTVQSKPDGFRLRQGYGEPKANHHSLVRARIESLRSAAGLSQ